MKLLAGLLLVYGAFLVGIFAAMHQPVERFGRIMSYMPGPLFMVTRRNGLTWPASA